MSLNAVYSAESVIGENELYFVAHLLEGIPNFLLCAFDLGRVGEWPVMPARLAGEGGAGSIGIVANGDYRLDVTRKKFVHVL